MKLLIGPELLAAIRAEAEAAWPGECCGLMVGRRGADACSVDRIVAAANLAAAPERQFEVDPAVLLATHRQAREAGEVILGPYHSHPEGAARPSATDLARARDGAEAGEVWLIVAGAAGRVEAAQAFVFDGTDFRPLPLAQAAGLGRARP